MSVERHHLAEEFPQFKAKIHELKLGNRHFKRLFEDYESLDKEINSIEQDSKAVSDEYAEGLKKKRVKLKDELYTMLVAD